MTSLSTIPRRAASFARHGGPSRLLTIGAGVVVVLGVVAATVDRFDLAFVAVLLVQGALLALLTLGRRQNVAVEGAVLRRLDESDARVLTDVSRARQALLTALDERAENGPR